MQVGKLNKKTEQSPCSLDFPLEILVPILQVTLLGKYGIFPTVFHYNKKAFFI